MRRTASKKRKSKKFHHSIVLKRMKKSLENAYQESTNTRGLSFIGVINGEIVKIDSSESSSDKTSHVIRSVKPKVFIGKQKRKIDFESL
jgi:hypothetical protein